MLDNFRMVFVMVMVLLNFWMVLCMRVSLKMENIVVLGFLYELMECVLKGGFKMEGLMVKG